MSLAALDFINAGKSNGFYSVDDTGDQRYYYSLCDYYIEIVTHDKNSATVWNAAAPKTVFNSWVVNGYFEAY